MDEKLSACLDRVDLALTELQRAFNGLRDHFSYGGKRPADMDDGEYSKWLRAEVSRQIGGKK